MSLSRRLVSLDLLVLGLVFIIQAPTSSHANMLNRTVIMDRVDLPQPKKKDNVVEHSPDWLPAQEVLDLLKGNTITALSKTGGYRWWIYFSNSPPVVMKAVWKNDRAKLDVGVWTVPPSGALCMTWRHSHSETCGRVRKSGKVVRFDDSKTGKVKTTAVLYLGDPQNLAGK